jgi:hypothetical protein
MKQYGQATNVFAQQQFVSGRQTAGSEISTKNSTDYSTPSQNAIPNLIQQQNRRQTTDGRAQSNTRTQK